MTETGRPYRTPEITAGKIGVVNIPPILSHNGEAQVAVYSERKFLIAWRDAHNLDPENYPISDSDLLGPHIDIYGEDIERIFPDKSIISPFTSLMD